jgi:DNA polymerase III subunit delta'
MSGPEGTLRLRDGLVGQDSVFERFEHALREGRLGHAYLLLGPWGCGRTRTALALAQLLLCTGAAPPCGLCSGCRKSARLIHPDLYLVLPTTREDADDSERMGKLLEAYSAERYHLLGTLGNASIGIDRLRLLKENVSKALVEGNRRVVVFSSAERMTEQAAQSALKLAEEPPPQTVLILTAEEPAQLLPTLVSRCQRVYLRLLSRDLLARILTQDLGVSDQAALVLASLSGGSLGRALELRECDALELRDRVIGAFSIPAPDARSGIAPSEIERRVQGLERTWSVETAGRAGHLLLVWLRDILVLRCGLGQEVIANQDHLPKMKQMAEDLSVDEIRRRILLVEEMVQAVESNVNPVLALHAALTRTANGQSPDDATY